MAKTTIEWAEYSWNPVTGCIKISPGCKHCYAERFAERFRGVAGNKYEQGFDLKLWPERLEEPLRWKKPKLVFVCSMSDLFEENVPDDFIDQVFDVMEKASGHTFQVLTKRAERMADYIKKRVADGHPVPSNVWLGVTVENQDYVSRARLLAELPAKVRWLSLEPLLGPVDLSGLIGSDKINWLVVGGESGPGARPMEEAWAKGLRDQAVTSGIAFFFKQWGGVQKKKAGRDLDGRTWDEFPEIPPETASTIPNAGIERLSQESAA